MPGSYLTSTVGTNVSDRLTIIHQEVLSPVVDKLGLYPQLRGYVSEQQIVADMQKSITVDVANPGGGCLGAFSIAFSGRNPKDVATVATETVRVFVQENLKVREQTQNQFVYTSYRDLSGHSLKMAAGKMTQPSQTMSHTLSKENE